MVPKGNIPITQAECSVSQWPKRRGRQNKARANTQVRRDPTKPQTNPKFWKMHPSNPSLSLDLATKGMKLHLNRGDTHNALEVYQSVRDSSIAPDQPFLTTAMTLHLALNQLDTCEDLWHGLYQDHLTPLSHTQRYTKTGQ